MTLFPRSALGSALLISWFSGCPDPTAEPTDDDDSTAVADDDTSTGLDRSVPGSQGPRPGSPPVLTGPIKDGGSFPPPVGVGNRVPEAEVIIPTAEEVVAEHGAAAMPVPGDLGALPVDRLPGPTAQVFTETMFARVWIDLPEPGEPVGFQATGMSLLNGALVVPETVSGGLLIVASQAGVPVFVTTVADPRERRAVRDNGGAGSHNTSIRAGFLTASLPDALANEGALATTTLDVWDLPDSVAHDQVVDLTTTTALLIDSTLLGSVSGPTLVQLYLDALIQ